MKTIYNAVVAISLMVLGVSCSSSKEETLSNLGAVPTLEATMLGPEFMVPNSVGRQGVMDFREGVDFEQFAMVMATSQPSQGVDYATAKQHFETVISQYAFERPAFKTIAECNMAVFLTHYYFNDAPAVAAAHSDDLANYTKLLLKETPGNIRVLLPALVQLQSTWSKEELSQAIDLVLTHGTAELERQKTRVAESKSRSEGKEFPMDLNPEFEQEHEIWQAQLEYLERWAEII